MLELINIKKDYQLKDQEPVHALRGISLNFRSQEFVAILGHSGCGKTTLLNIIGGLDHYDDGDLIIKGKSTKQFKDADWDTYRNHSIGFVFQSYNLIPHQSILNNVELALTISGISKEERIRRAKEALDKVGLAGLYKKKPNQLSGGQMQRVSIARALVNNPEIVLADEPTGALDSETSVQIMDLLKEVANNHLVIMVTHNPELAEKYASRIVRMKDGLITSDTDPFDGVETEKSAAQVVEVNKGKKKHSSMGFFTAFGLSLSNLISKLRRTILVALAGSIGIIGVSTILGVSCGVNNYIDSMQNDMLSSYPIGIAEESVDLNSLVAGLTTQEKADLASFDTKTRIGMDSMINYLMTKYTDLTNVKTNDITETLIKYVEQMPKSYYSAIQYDYAIDPTNNIFTRFTPKKAESTVSDMISINGLTQRYIKTLMTVEGFSEYATFVDLFTAFMKEMPKEEEYILSQYDMIAGDHFASAEDEIMLVVDNNQTLTDLIFAQMGYYPQDEFLMIAKRIIKSNEVQKEYLDGKITKQEYERKLKEIAEKYPYETSFSVEDVLNHEFVYYPHDLIYNQDPKFVSHKEISGSMSGQLVVDYVLFNVFPIHLDYTIVLGGLEYVPADDALRGTLIALDNDNSMQLVLNQSLAFTRDNSVEITNPNKSVVDGKWKFDYKDYHFDLNIKTDYNPQTIGERTVSYNIEHAELNTNALELMMKAAIKEQFHVDVDLPDDLLSQLSPINFTNGKVSEETPETPDFYYEAYPKNNTKIENMTWAELEAAGARKIKVAGILKPKASTNFGTLSRGVYYSTAFAEKYINDAQGSNILTEYVKHIKSKRFQSYTFNAYTTFVYDDYTNDPGTEGWEPEETKGFASALNGGMQSTLSSLFFSFMGGGNNLNTEKEHIRAIGGLKIVEIPDPNDPMDSLKFKYSTELLPKSVSIYPKDFQRKNNVTRYLDQWNKDKTLIIDGQEVPKAEREEITYTDTISMIVTVISTLVTTVSAALIAFTSLSLVVSCFMIAVITYISVMERVKEIGVIRSLGGRKRDVSTLFISENLITGFASGTIGILVTYILQFIINAIVAPYGVSSIAALPFLYALLMIALSVALSVISGLIPSLGASKQDPVVALRTE